MDKYISQIRTFFRVKGFIEVYPESVSILETKEPITFERNQRLPVRQTCKMYLENEMLNHPHIGYFCISYSDVQMIPWFEFELKGGQKIILQLQQELLEFMDIEYSIQELTNVSFWTMKNEVVYRIRGIETIYCSELLCDPLIMKDNFNAYSNLYTIFGKERVDDELNAFLNHRFIERCSGRINIKNMIRAIHLS